MRSVVCGAVEYILILSHPVGGYLVTAAQET